MRIFRLFSRKEALQSLADETPRVDFPLTRSQVVESIFTQKVEPESYSLKKWE